MHFVTMTKINGSIQYSVKKEKEMYGYTDSIQLAIPFLIRRTQYVFAIIFDEECLKYKTTCKSFMNKLHYDFGRQDSDERLIGGLVLFNDIKVYESKEEQRFKFDPLTVFRSVPNTLMCQEDTKLMISATNDLLELLTVDRLKHVLINVKGL